MGRRAWVEAGGGILDISNSTRRYAAPNEVFRPVTLPTSARECAGIATMRDSGSLLGHEGRSFDQDPSASRQGSCTLAPIDLGGDGQTAALSIDLRPRLGSGAGDDDVCRGHNS